MNRHHLLRVAIFVVGLAAALPSPARADGFISPFIGRNVGVDSACPNLRNCETKNNTWGVAIGSMGNVFGFEEDINFSNNFLGEAPNFDSKVTSFMSNLMVIPKFGPVRPYTVAGVGIIMTRASLDAPSVQIADNNLFGYDYGGGLAVFFGDHIGVRAEVRWFRTLQDLAVLGITLSDTKLSYGRTSGALVFKF